MVIGLILGWLVGCKGPCLDLCQQYEIYLEECGYGWSTAFEEQGWKTLDDCYDAHWEANQNQQMACQTTIAEYSEKSCY